MGPKSLGAQPLGPGVGRRVRLRIGALQRDAGICSHLLEVAVKLVGLNPSSATQPFYFDLMAVNLFTSKCFLILKMEIVWGLNLILYVKPVSNSCFLKVTVLAKLYPTCAVLSSVCILQ